MTRDKPWYMPGSWKGLKRLFAPLIEDLQNTFCSVCTGRPFPRNYETEKTCMRYSRVAL